MLSYIVMRKCLVKRVSIIFICILFLIIVNKDYSFSSSVYRSMPVQENTEHRFVTKMGDNYFYYSNTGVIVTSNDKDRLRRINDTYYFVDEEGMIHGKYVRVKDITYRIAYDKGLEKLVGKELTYDNIMFYAGTEDIIKKKMSHSSFIADGTAPLDTLFINNEDKKRNNEIMVLGDSYAYYLMLYGNIDYRFAICPGYALQDIKNELLDEINFTGVKQVLLFIGPNDLMRQTDIYDFLNDLDYIIDFIKSRGAEVILTNYFNIPNTAFPTDYLVYDNLVRCASMWKQCKYIDLSELDSKYPRAKFDEYVHPPKDFYEAAIAIIVNSIK